MIRRTFLLVSFALAFSVGAPETARADIITPAGLNAGDHFRIIFASSTTHDALSSDILVYDAFITGLANAAGLGTYGGAPVTWQAVGSTATVDAISRLPNSSPAIYLPNGINVVASGADLWNGSFLNAPIDKNEFGNDVPTGEGGAFTGTTETGVKFINRELGTSSGLTIFGSPSAVFTDWVNSDWYDPSEASLFRFYGVSSELTVGGAASVPEPGGLILVVMGIAGYVGQRRMRKLAV